MTNDASSITTIANIRTDCVVGMLLAYDSVNEQYIPASPAWTNDISTGAIIPAASAYIVGMLQTLNADRSGTLLVSGVVTDGTLISALTGNNAANGGYYLSGNGVAAPGVPDGLLPVYCGTKVNANTFYLNPAPPIYGGHTHDLCLLDSTQGTWNESGTIFSATSTAAQILAGVPEESICLLHNGAIVNSADYVISGSYITLSGGLTSVGTYQLSPINRLIATQPEVQAVAPATTNDIIKTSRTFGTVYIDTDFNPTTTGVLTGSAVIAITSSGVSTGPVVQNVSAGAGIGVAPDGSGGVIVSANTYSDYLDLQVVNAHNVLIGNGINDPYITFPAMSGTADITGIVRLPANLGGKTIQAFAWMQGPGGALSGSMSLQSIPNSATTAAIVINPPTSAGENDVNEVLTSGALIASAAGNGLATLVISAVSPADPIRIKAIGLKLVSE